MSARVLKDEGDPRLWVDDDLAAELGSERSFQARLRPTVDDVAFVTMFKLGLDGGGLMMRWSEADCRAAAAAFDRIADEMGKRAAESR